MVRIRSQNELILSLIDFYRSGQPLLDTKPGTVARDVFIDGPSYQLSQLYQELEKLRTIQSIRLAIGADLDKLGSNYNATRKSGSKSGGTSLLTFKSIPYDIPINKGEIITARNGMSFVVKNGFVVNAINSNTYRAIASQYRSDLDLAGITDTFAVEVLVEASTAGIQGNISKYSLVSTKINGVSNVTNPLPFGGGSSSEDDASYRSRILALFSGANTGTSLGYRNAVLQDPASLDAMVIEPGDILMTRDGTQVATDPDTGITSVISEGTGGKVDVYALGSKLQEIIESYIYADKSNTGKTTSTDNDHVLGQIPGDENKTVTRKRLDNIKNGITPNQPVNNIVQVSGSASGSNFIAKNVDAYGIITGNYELIKDDGAYGGSPWGFDRLRWISDRISGLNEDKTKGTYNGQDSLYYTDSIKINYCTQKINIINENSTINKTDKSIIQLLHYPVTNVTRVFNATTGERYVISNQNLYGTGSVNNTGTIQIKGSSLPATSDILQVDYTWIKTYDPYIDFDGKISNINPNPREVIDSIDWGYSNAIRREEEILSNINTISVKHPISTVISVNSITTENKQVTQVSTGSATRNAVIVDNKVENVVSVIRTADGADLWNTSKEDGTFSGYTIYLPTDNVSNVYDAVTVYYNAIDIYNTDGYTGSFDNKTITIVVPQPDFDPLNTGLIEVNYIANVNTLLTSTTIANLPAIRNGNYFNTKLETGIGYQPTTHIFDNNGNIVTNLRQAPSNLALTISGSISPGTLTISGNTLIKVTDAIVSVSSDGLTIELSSTIREALGLSSTSSIPTNIKIARVVKVDKVQSDGVVVYSTDFEFDIKGYKIYNNSLFRSESISDSSLTYTSFKLQETYSNKNNQPKIGEKLLITFYLIKENDSENVPFSKAGTLYTQKIFSTVNSVSVSSGFASGSSQISTLTISCLNQPFIGNKYIGNYDYIAPKQNERITIRYNLNKLIPDTTLLVENVRPISADVLVKEAKPIYIDVELNIVVKPEYVNNSNIVVQNVKDAVTSSLNISKFGQIIDSSDVIVTAQSVEGVDRVRIIQFNKADESGSVLSISAENNEYLQSNNVIINLETR